MIRRGTYFEPPPQFNVSNVGRGLRRYVVWHNEVCKSDQVGVFKVTATPVHRCWTQKGAEKVRARLLVA